MLLLQGPQSQQIGTEVLQQLLSYETQVSVVLLAVIVLQPDRVLRITVIVQLLSAVAQL